MTTRRSARARVRLSTPADILSSIPYLIGYHPGESVVVIGMRQRQVTFAARDELSPDGLPPSGERVRTLVDVVTRQRCDGVLIVGFGDEHRVGPAVWALGSALEQANVEIREALRADDGRYWSYLCNNPSCCSPDGTAYDPLTSEVAATWTLAGRAAMRDRAEYESQLHPVAGPEREAIRTATAAASARLLDLVADALDEQHAHAILVAAGTRAVADALDGQLRGSPPTTDEIAWLSVLLMDVAVRDVAWFLIIGAGREPEAHRALWQHVLCRAEPDVLAPPATLFALAAWRCGDAGIARLAVEQALDVDPDYRLAGMLHQAIVGGLSPSVMDELGSPLATRRRRGGRRSRRSSTARAGTRRA
jgi:hypothetical protein